MILQKCIVALAVAAAVSVRAATVTPVAQPCQGLANVLNQAGQELRSMEASVAQINALNPVPPEARQLALQLKAAQVQYNAEEEELNACNKSASKK
jgi:hypothetical protein